MTTQRHQPPTGLVRSAGPPGSAVDAAARSQGGTDRPANEDRAFVGTTVFAVADGMGGRRDGDVAAEEAIAAVRVTDGQPADGSAVTVQLRAVLAAANRRVQDRAEQDAMHTGMGTTLTALAVTADQVWVAWVGDSPAFRVRGTTCDQLTAEHTLVRRLVDIGELTPSEAWDHPDRNVITRAVGVKEQVEVDTTSADLRPGDCLVVCSDGVSDTLRPETIGDLVAGAVNATNACDRLVEAAVRAGSTDDVTALVVRIE